MRLCICCKIEHDGVLKTCDQCRAKHRGAYERDREKRLLKKKEYYKKKHHAINAKRRRVGRSRSPEEKAKKRAYDIVYRENNPHLGYKSTLKRYGLTLEEYDRMLVAQRSLCAICCLPSDQKLCVDHDHVTGKVRQLLCRHCNSTIGLVRESPEIAEWVAAYIRKHSSQ